MPPVFAHGRLRLYLLKLLAESPRHGYEVIRLLEERFQGRYAPSAGTVYPRLAKLEKEGLVSHTTEGGRKVYALTDAGRAELDTRQEELADLEREIGESVSELAAEIRDDVRGAAGDLRREMREAARQAARPGGRDAVSEEYRRWQQEWRDQARQAREESRRAREEARNAREQARQAQAFARDEVQRIVRRVQETVQDHARRGDWQGAVREGLAGINHELGQFGRTAARSDDPGAHRPDADRAGADQPAAGRADAGGEAERINGTGRPSTGQAGTGQAGTEQAGSEQAGAGHPGEPADVADATDAAAVAEAADAAAGGGGAGPGGAGAADAAGRPDWAADQPAGDDPERDLQRLLDRFRDDVRDAARDHGVTPEQVREARRELSAAAARIVAALHQGRR